MATTQEIFRLYSKATTTIRMAKSAIQVDRALFQDRKIMSKINILILALACLLLEPSSAFSAGLCATDLAERVPISGSKWTILTEVYRCSVMDAGKMNIVAVNSETQERVNLVAFGEETESTVTIAGNDITITVPNLVYVLSKSDRFQNYQIAFRFTPMDDPEARRNYEFWLQHPSDPRAQDWYKKNLLDNSHPYNGAQK